ncbi:MAG: flagellin [Acidobacteriota bacterium]|jgi:flagellin|nr:flagellin [Acidobacteriota bacterium]
MGSFSILNNISAVNGQHMLNVNNVNLNRTLQRMSSGLRINTGADDAAGLQIADGLRANVYALNQAIRNAGDGISFLQIADGALGEITNMLHRMVTLAEEAANEPIDQRGRDALDNEFQELQAEIARLALQTNFNGQNIFATNRDFGATLDLFVGDTSGTKYKATGATGSAASISVVMGFIKVAVDATKYGDDRMKIVSMHRTGSPTTLHPDVSLGTVNLTTHGNAAGALQSISAALNEVSNMRGTIGAGLNRLQAAISVLQTQSRNTLSAESAIRDANMAEEITNMTRYQILSQTGIAALSHSNANSRIVLSLLQQ